MEKMGTHLGRVCQATIHQECFANSANVITKKDPPIPTTNPKDRPDPTPIKFDRIESRWQRDRA